MAWQLPSCAGFPSGKHVSAVKAAEAARAIADGADEIDMVIDIGAAVAGDFAAVEADIAAVRAAMLPDRVLKVIIESAALSDEAIVGGVPGRRGRRRRLRQDVHRLPPLRRRDGARGGTHGVDGRRATRGEGLGRSAHRRGRLAMIAAGATRLGLSGTRAVLDGLESADADDAEAATEHRGRRRLLSPPGLDAECLPHVGLQLGHLRFGEAARGGDVSVVNRLDDL